MPRLRGACHHPARGVAFLVACRSSPINNSTVTDSIRTRIQREVGSWDGVTTAPHRYGGLEFRLERRELGHLHGSRLADLPFPIAVRQALVASGRAMPHHILPESGWVSRWIDADGDTDKDAADVIALFRMNYERPWLRLHNPLRTLP